MFSNVKPRRRPGVAYQHLVIAAVLVCVLPALVQAQGCGRITSENPVQSSTHEIVDGGELSSLRGRVIYPNEKPAESVIVELYRDALFETGKERNYLYVDQIIKQGRISALYLESGGRFCFKNLKPGRYMLRVGMSYDTQWAITSIFVSLDKKAKKAQKTLSVELSMAI